MEVTAHPPLFSGFFSSRVGSSLSYFFSSSSVQPFGMVVLMTETASLDSDLDHIIMKLQSDEQTLLEKSPLQFSQQGT